MKQMKIRKLRATMRQLQRALGWQWKNDAACCGITVAQCHSLMEIGAKEEITLNELASKFGLDISTLSRTVEGMVKTGLVERQTKPEDRRYLVITMTEKGKEIYDRINQTFDHYYSEALTTIPRDKQEQVIESLELLAKALTSCSEANTT